MLSGLTANMSIMLMTERQIDIMQTAATTNPPLKNLVNELRNRLRAINGPVDFDGMSQAYEAFAEAAFCFALNHKGVKLGRTPGTGQHQQKRPDFVHKHASGDIYFEVKALEISDRLSRNPDIATEALEIAAEVSDRARTPGVHVSDPLVVSGHRATDSLQERIDETIERIANTLKPEQLRFGPTILVVDLGRLPGIPQGPSGLLPVFFHDALPSESVVSGELWQIALGKVGERLFHHPEFDGASNLSGHQTKAGILHQFPMLFGISFLLPRWSESPEILTICNFRPEERELQTKCTLSEDEIEELLIKYSDGTNDSANERGWFYRKISLSSD